MIRLLCGRTSSLNSVKNVSAKYKLLWIEILSLPKGCFLSKISNSAIACSFGESGSGGKGVKLRKVSGSSPT